MEKPYVYVDYEKLIKNIVTMSEICKENNVALKPHFKSHKTIKIAREQLIRGAIEITTSTLKETKALIDAGFKNIIFAYPLVGENKIALYKNLGTDVSLSSLVLNYDHGAYLNAYFSENNPCHVWFKVNTGLNRLGINPNEIPTELEKLKKLKSIVVEGLLTHGGHSYSGK